MDGWLATVPPTMSFTAYNICMQSIQIQSQESTKILILSQILHALWLHAVCALHTRQARSTLCQAITSNSPAM